jgi:hypothetical protein
MGFDDEATTSQTASVLRQDESARTAIIVFV